jgi:hypothetical protein
MVQVSRASVKLALFYLTIKPGGYTHGATTDFVCDFMRQEKVKQEGRLKDLPEAIGS